MSLDPSRVRPAPAAAPIAWMNDRVVPAAEATVPLLDDGFLRGDAVFEGILVRHGRTHALEAHLARMRRSAKSTGIRLPLLKKVVGDLLAAWGERDGALRLIVTRSGTVRGLLQATSWPDTFALAVVDTPWQTALTGVKTVSYAPNMWATREAVARHADDAVIVSDATVLELPTAAVVWSHDGRLRSPDPARLPILDSVTLRELMKVADVALGVYPLDDLLGADEVMVVSASRPALPVHAIDDVELPAPGPVTSEVHAALVAHIDATLDPLP